MTGHTITVTILQEFADGSRRKCEVANRDDVDEPQQQIGAAVGNALRQILAAQQTGCNAEFWMAFLTEAACFVDGGHWERRLRDAIEQWWKNASESDVSLQDHMRKIVR